MSDNRYKIKSHNDTISIPLKPYTVKDDSGNTVRINPKIKTNHDSWHKEQNHPTVFHNLGFVIKEYDRKGPSTSKNPSALQANNKGNVVIYEVDDFMTKLDVPGFTENYPNHTAKVVVYYPHDNKPAYTKTYNLTRKVK